MAIQFIADPILHLRLVENFILPTCKVNLPYRTQRKHFVAQMNLIDSEGGCSKIRGATGVNFHLKLQFSTGKRHTDFKSIVCYKQRI